MKRGIAWLLAFLLTVALILFCVTFVGRQMIVPGMRDSGAPVSSRVVTAEKELIREKVEELAELYRFSAEPVINAINDETLKELNEQASLWWNSVLADGTPGQELKMDTQELKQVLAEDPLVKKSEDPDTLVETAAEQISKGVAHIILPMRQEIMDIGMKEAGKRVDLINVLDFLIRVPWAALALAVLLAGLIALLESRRISGCLKYIGCAMGAAAIVVTVAAILTAQAGVRPMILEASRSLAVQYDSVLSEAAVLTGILVLILLAGYVLCLIFYRRNCKAHEA